MLTRSVFFLVAMDAVQVVGYKIGDPRPYTAISAPAPAAPATSAAAHQPYGAPTYGAPAAPPPSYGAPAQPAYASAAPVYGGGGYGQQPQQQQQYSAPPPQQQGYAAGPGARSPPSLASAGSAIQPISSLNPYASRWTIKARCTAKTDLKSWSNPKGSGTLFSVDLLDEAGGEIRATFFK